MQQLASQNAPSPKLITPHFLFGASTFLLALTLLSIFPESLSGHFFNPITLAITHLLVLGWISMIIFGALYQLIPVIFEAKLYSERLGYISFYTLAIGTLMLSYSFYQFQTGPLLHSGMTLIFIAALAFVINVFKTILSSRKSGIERLFISSSVFWFFLTISFGVLLAVNLSTPFLSKPHLELLKIHAHTGLGGWFLLLIMGVANKLLPMFLVSHSQQKTLLLISLYTSNAAVVLSMFAFYYSSNWLLNSSALLIATGVISYLLHIRNLYIHRVKKQLDIGMKQSMLAFITLLPILCILILNAFGLNSGIHSERSATGYGFLIIIGFISSLVMGQTYKTLPFIVWLEKYRPYVGKHKLPFPKNLYSEKLSNIQLWLFSIGMTSVFLGVMLSKLPLIQTGSLIMLFSAVIYFLNVLKIIFHQTQIPQNEQSR